MLVRMGLETCRLLRAALLKSGRPNGSGKSTSFTFVKAPGTRIRPVLRNSWVPAVPRAAATPKAHGHFINPDPLTSHQELMNEIKSVTKPELSILIQSSLEDMYVAATGLHPSGAKQV